MAVLVATVYPSWRLNLARSQPTWRPKHHGGLPKKLR